MHSLMNRCKENTLLTPPRTLELCQPPQKPSVAPTHENNYPDKATNTMN